MLTTYEAILHGNVLEWRHDAPQQFPLDQEVIVHVTFLEKTPMALSKRGPQMAAALAKLAQSTILNNLDAVEWEREMREDKTLEGRSE